MLMRSTPKTLLTSLLLGAALAASAADDAQALRAGATLMKTQVYSPEDDRRVLAAFEGLRVADVSDGMDFVGLQDKGLATAIREDGRRWLTELGDRARLGKI